MKRQIKVSKAVNTKSAPTFMNGNIISDIIVQNDKLCKEQFEKIKTDIFKGYITTGKDDNTSKKVIYNLSHDPERIPTVITEILNCIQSKAKVPDNSKPIVKIYYLTRNAKCIMDVPHENLGMRILLNYNHSEVFYLDPIYEKLNANGTKDLFNTDLPEKYIKILSNNYAILAPGNMYRYTIRDIKDEKIKNNHMDSEYSRNKTTPRVSNYERINITIDYILSENLAAKMKELQNETIMKMAVQSGISDKNLKKQIDNIKNNKNVQRSAEQFNKLVTANNTSDILNQMNKVDTNKQDDDIFIEMDKVNVIEKKEDDILNEMNKVDTIEKDGDAILNEMNKVDTIEK